MRWALLAVAVLAVVAFLGVGSYIGGEMRYRNCLQRVELEYPTAFQARGENTAGEGLGLGGNQYEANEPEPHFEFFRQGDREGAVSRCSPWP
jgi:hypothetical protein